jgi:hypothetical protein
LPEIWIPFGPVETLVTVQAENLGAVVEPAAEKSSGDMERIGEAVKGASALLICDSAPSTFEVVRDLVAGAAVPIGLKVLSPAPKKVEASVPDLKGRVTTLPPPVKQEGGAETAYAPELTAPGRKVFVGTARPDPLFGIVDPRVQACLNWVAGSLVKASQARGGMEPQPFQKTKAFEVAEGLVEEVPDSTFLSVVPRGGKAKAVLEDAPFDAQKNGFMEVSMPQSRALIVGSGGRGFDDTFSSALRGVWSALPGARRSATILLVAECSEGLGSTALEMLATGRLVAEGRRREKNVDGLEDVFYLNKLKDEYDVILLSGLPETYSRNKLGLAAAKGSGEAVGRLLNKVGRTGKVNLVTRAPECRVASA